ncbi:exopolysaccharide biosynthesis protein [Candidatus Odyssella thessalonicensis]|uniref:exopolysaccharide biosynthesis protein n=1 Tax=Candidatus Odyssella thessalonicensis TaxID=84647 RepID=UPI000225C0B0|nr:exopolysaccharide biosynthesis protein [Candidatus Odyssella thessalonicensis]
MKRRTILQLLESYIDHHPEAHISVNDLLHSLGDRGYGLALLVLALPNALLLTAIPGTSTFFGLPICFLALQLILRRSHLWLPQRLRSQQVSRQTLLLILRNSTRYLLKIEHFIKPRWPFMTDKYMEQLLGVFIFILGVIITLPIPFGNFLGGWGVMLFSLALIEKDGVLALLAVILTTLMGLAMVRIAGNLIGFLSDLF